jgi:hypothetical protein
VEEALGASKRIKGVYADLHAETCNYIQCVALGLTEFLHALNFRYVLCSGGGELVVSRHKGSIVQCKRSKNHENGA